MKTDNIIKLISYRCVTVFAVLVSLFSLTACGSGSSAAISVASVDVSSSATDGRSNATVVLTPVASGNSLLSSDNMTVDISNASEGYIIIRYSGDSEKTKFQITGPSQVTYTYNIAASEDVVIPLSSGSGSYMLTAYESIGNDQYAACFSDEFNVNITNEFGPFLYPNQYVDFNENTKAVTKAKELVSSASCDLEAVGLIYDFVINNVTYDQEEAKTVETNYLPDVDEVMDTGKGICFDYASLMAAMLRSQGIPTRLEIGYAKDAYHAWISVYTKDQGWIGGVIQFDGSNWTLMDPTLASNSKDISKIKSFIGDGSSYTVKYMY
ncbi:MAG: transglutaminase-like domain-containing protein [Lachnospiraceae bacterium]|nr:transglutaminase-like domain-containing protein [Lachnospiraceae bacterium]